MYLQQSQCPLAQAYRSHLIAERLEGVKQYLVDAYPKECKPDIFNDLLESLSPTSAIIFCNSEKSAKWVFSKVEEMEYSARVVYDRMDQEQLSLAIASFREGVTRVLVSTDVLGGDPVLEEAGIVINFDFPVRKESYLSRLGCISSSDPVRAAISLTTQDDEAAIEVIQSSYNTVIAELPADFNGKL